MPALGFGTWQLDGLGCVSAVENALKIGYRHIDTAQMYGNEAEVGQAIKNSGVTREDIFLTTKIWPDNYISGRISSSTITSLNKLKTDYVDLLLLHWPNPDVSLEETLQALQKLLMQGRARAIGVSNFPVSLMQEAIEKYHAPIACNQIEYHPMLSQNRVIEYAQSHNMVVIAYSPLARGKLTDDPQLTEIGKKYGKNANQVILRWIIEQNVAAIPKASSEKNARENFDIFDFSLDENDMQRINSLDKNSRLVNPTFAPKWDAA